MALRDTSWVLASDTNRTLQTSNGIRIAGGSDNTKVVLVGGGGTYIRSLKTDVREWILLSEAAAFAARAVMESGTWAGGGDTYGSGAESAFGIQVAESRRILGSYTLTLSQQTDTWSEVVET